MSVKCLIPIWITCLTQFSLIHSSILTNTSHHQSSLATSSLLCSHLSHAYLYRSCLSLPPCWVLPCPIPPGWFILCLPSLCCWTLRGFIICLPPPLVSPPVVTFVLCLLCARSQGQFWERPAAIRPRASNKERVFMLIQFYLKEKFPIGLCQTWKI